MNRINWALVIVFGAVVLLVFLVGASLLGSYVGWGPGWGTIDPGMMGGWGFGSFGWLGMISMWLFPWDLLALGIVWLVRQVSGPSKPLEGPFQAPAGQRLALTVAVRSKQTGGTVRIAAKNCRDRRQPGDAGGRLWQQGLCVNCRGLDGRGAKR